MFGSFVIELAEAPQGRGSIPLPPHSEHYSGLFCPRPRPVEGSEHATLHWIAALTTVFEAVERHRANELVWARAPFAALFNADRKRKVEECRPCHLHDPEGLCFEVIAANRDAEARAARGSYHERLGPPFADTKICMFECIADGVQVARVCCRRHLEVIVEKVLRQPEQAAHGKFSRASNCDSNRDFPSTTSLLVQSVETRVRGHRLAA